MKLSSILKEAASAGNAKLPAGFKLPKGFKLKWKMASRPTGKWASFQKRGSWELTFTTPDGDGKLLMFLHEIDPDDPYRKKQDDFDAAKPWCVYVRPDGLSGATKVYKGRFASEDEARNFADHVLSTKELVQNWVKMYSKEEKNEAN